MEEMRNILRRLLGAMGFTKVTIARHGEEAWSLIQAHNYDLVLCDWNMPRMSGHELLKRVRTDARFASLPFIMITGENSTEQVKSAIADGVTDFIIKPFTTALLTCSYASSRTFSFSARRPSNRSRPGTSASLCQPAKTLACTCNCSTLNSSDR